MERAEDSPRFHRLVLYLLATPFGSRAVPLRDVAKAAVGLYERIRDSISAERRVRSSSVSGASSRACEGCRRTE